MLNSLNRRPWASKTALMVIVTAVGTVAVTLGVATDTVDVWTGSLAAFFAAAVDLGILRQGETETTPVDDPVGRDGLPLLPFRKVEDLHEALNEGDLDKARAVVGAVRPH